MRLNNSKGFTLIELIIIIIILGILAAVAIPKFVDMQESSRKGVAEGILGSLRSAETVMFSRYLMDNAQTYTLSGVVSNVQVDGNAGVAAISSSSGRITVGSSTYNFTYTSGVGTAPGVFTKGW